MFGVRLSVSRGSWDKLLKKRATGKVGSNSTVAKCAAAAKHHSDEFTIDEEKPYGEVRRYYSINYKVFFIELFFSYGWGRIPPSLLKIYSRGEIWSI